MADQHIQPFRHAHQIYYKANFYLPHDFAVVNLQRDLANPKLRRRLLVARAADHERQYIGVESARRTAFLISPARLDYAAMHDPYLGRHRWPARAVLH
jgi:hypothetical protein